MFTSTPEGAPAPRRDGGREDASRAPWGEARSFAPADELGARAPLSIESFIRPPEAAFAEAAPGEAMLTEAERRRRALIVIPALNEARAIARVIEHVLDDEGLVDPLVVVADGGSSDGTQDIVRAIAARDGRVRLIDNPGRVQSAALNLAVRALAGDRPWLVRVDAHADYPKNYASTLIAEAMRTGASSVVVSMDTVGEDGFQRAVAVAQNSRLGAGGAPHRQPSQGRWVDHGHHALFFREAYQAVGGYDESFSHNEDAEFDLRLGKLGGRIWLTDRLRIAYHPRSTPTALAAQYFSYGKGRARTVLKHHTALKLRQALPLAVAPAVASLLLAPLFWALAVPALVWAAVCLGYGLALAARRGDPAAALSGPAAMIMHLAWSLGFWAQLVTWKPPSPELEALERLRATP